MTHEYNYESYDTKAEKSDYVALIYCRVSD